MLSKIITLLLLLVFTVSIYIFFSLSPSYQKSYEAKYLFFLNEYDEALEIAHEAYELNHYNRMAFTIITQSKNNLKYIKFIEEAEDYYDKIDTIVSSSRISIQDRARIVMMCKVVIDDYGYVIKFKTRFTDDDLLARAKDIRDKFVVIKENIED